MIKKCGFGFMSHKTLAAADNQKWEIFFKVYVNLSFIVHVCSRQTCKIKIKNKENTVNLSIQSQPNHSYMLSKKKRK